MRMKQLPLLLIWLLSWAELSAQQIWPGDVNNNGIVNGVDLLYWGQAQGAMGPARAQVSSEWMAMSAPAPWSASFPNGINYAYADCNGDGQVNEDDFDEAIEGNYGLTQGARSGDGFANAPPGSAAPAIRLSTTTPVVGPGGTALISLSIDDSARPLSDFYGMALSLSYGTEYLDGDDGLDFELNENTWLNRDGSYVEELFEDNDNGAAMLAMTRTDQQTVAVEAGELGRFSVVIEDIIISKEIDTIRIQIDSILLIGQDFEAIATQATRIEIIVAQDPNSVVVATKAAALSGAAIEGTKVFPNPTSQHFFVESKAPIRAIEIFNALGQRIDHQMGRTDTQVYQVRLHPGQANGLLWIRIWIGRQAITRKLLYQSD